MQGSRGEGENPSGTGTWTGTGTGTGTGTRSRTPTRSPSRTRSLPPFAGAEADAAAAPVPDRDPDPDADPDTDPITDTDTDTDTVMVTGPSPESGGRVRAFARTHPPPPARVNVLVVRGSSSVAGVRAGRLPPWRATSPYCLPVRSPARAAGRDLLQGETSSPPHQRSPRLAHPHRPLSFHVSPFTFHERAGGWISLHVSARTRSRSWRTSSHCSMSRAPTASSRRRWLSTSSAEP